MLNHLIPGDSLALFNKQVAGGDLKRPVEIVIKAGGVPQAKSLGLVNSRWKKAHVALWATWARR